MEWIHLHDRSPEKEKFYKCLCVNGRRVKCKFRKGKDGPREYRPDLFIYRKRVPYVLYWKEK